VTPPPADSSHPATSRLATALRLSLAYRAQGRSDAQEFLAEHRDLADLLEPMIAPHAADGEGSGEASGDAPAGEMNGPATPTIAGYRIDGELGQGGMSIVWSATQTELGRPVALKVMRPVVVHERMQRRFMREAAILARLDHPYIVRVFDAATSLSATYLALERVDGTSLAAILAAVRRAGLATASGATIRAALAGALPEQADPGNEPPPPIREQPYCDALVELLAPIAEALHYAHAQGVIHRDVKPSNILVRRDGRAVLSDFGIARDDAPRDASESVALAGTPDSLAPEQLDGCTADARSDVYGLGVTLYTALTLQPPFAGHPVQVLAQIRRGEPRDPRQLNPQIPRDLAAVLAKAMAKASIERYVDAASFAADLRAVLAHAPVSARPVRAWRRWREAIRRRPWRAVAWTCGGLTTLLALGLAAGFSAQLAAQTRRRHAALAEIERLGWSVELERSPPPLRSPRRTAARSRRWSTGCTRRLARCSTRRRPSRRCATTCSGARCRTTASPRSPTAALIPRPRPWRASRMNSNGQPTVTPRS
jgi:serine/threonine protein kinase